MRRRNICRVKRVRTKYSYARKFWLTKNFNDKRIKAASTSNAFAGARRSRHRYMKAFAPLFTVRRADFQLKNIGAAVVRGGVIKRDKCRHIDRQTFFDVGRFQRAALDNDAAVRR